jgi:hypothetical protein
MACSASAGLSLSGGAFSKRRVLRSMALSELTPSTSAG